MTSASSFELAQMRAAMDAINDRLVAVLHERAQLCRTIARWKQQHYVELSDPAREAAMLERLLQPGGDGFPPAALERILRVVFAESRALVQAHGQR